MKSLTSAEIVMFEEQATNMKKSGLKCYEKAVSIIEQNKKNNWQGIREEKKAVSCKEHKNTKTEIEAELEQLRQKTI